jgi:uncharacterized protein
MKLVSEQRIDAPRRRVWEALNDPQALRESIPGCESLERVAEDRFTATVDVKVGPIGARFKGVLTLSDLDPPNGYTLHMQGSGIAGSVKGSARVRLREDAGRTFISYDVDAQVGGRLAQLGGPIVDASAKQIAGTFFKRFSDTVGGTGAADPVGATPAAYAAPGSGGGLPAPGAGRRMAWILTIPAALAGFVVGRVAGNHGLDWWGLASGLIVIAVAAAAFEYGRRSAAPTLDSAALRRIIERAKE